MVQTGELGRGAILAGRYELGTILGKGGMGVVFRRRHLGTDRPIAVKVLRREFAADPTLAKRFVREVKAAAALRHPNVVDVLDYGVDDDGTAFQVLELLDGESLREHLERKDTLRLDLTLALLFPVMHALAMAHERGVIHRDLKPDNVFLARNVHGRVVPKLLDFGIAKVMPKDGGAAATVSTRVGTVMGTPAYMSPEQARGTPDVGTATDIWAIGVILFECLAGRIPFEAQTPTMLMARIMMEQAPGLATVAPAVPAAVAAVIDRALASKSDQRWPTMDAFADELRRTATAAGVAVPAVGASDTPPMSIPPPRAPDEDDSDPGAMSSDDDIDIELDTATRAATSRRARVSTGASTEGAGPALAALAPPPALADADPPPPVARPKGRDAELGFLATAPRLAAPLSSPERPPMPRLPLAPIAAVSLVIAALVVVGAWMNARPSVEPPRGSMSATIDAPVVPPPVVPPPVVEPLVVEPPVVAALVVEPPVVEPLVVEPPVAEPALPLGLDPVDPTRAARPLHRTTTSATATEHVETPSPPSPAATPERAHSRDLPGLSAW